MTEEKEFLKNYRLDEYERPSVTADIVVLKIRSEHSDNYRQDSRKKLSVLLIKRGGHPFKDCWALPGGFLSPGETIEECAMREAEEETSVKPSALMSLGMFSKPGRDPRGWIISNAFVSVIPETEVRQQSGDDASDAQWFDVSLEGDGREKQLRLSFGGVELCADVYEEKREFGTARYRIDNSGGLAFDHAGIIATALTVLRNRAESFEFIFDFLPGNFTLTQLQSVFEAVTDSAVLPANFRRKISPYVEETDEYTSGAGHRPARLFRRK